MIPERVWLARSGQMWKLRASELLLVVGFLMLLGMGRAVEDDDLGLMRAPLAPLALGFLGLSVGIRCRSCGTAVGWWAMTNRKAGAWLMALETMHSCPVCGDDGSAAADK